MVLSLLSAALAWDCLVVLLAFEWRFASLSSSPGSHFTFVTVEGTTALWMPLAPVGVFVVVAALVLLPGVWQRRSARCTAYTLVGLVAAGGMLGTVTFLIGAFLLPGAGLLLGACAVADDVRRYRRPEPALGPPGD